MRSGLWFALLVVGCLPDLARDDDLDGFITKRDCDDQDVDVNPDAEEICGDGIDSNCDGAALPCNTYLTDDLNPVYHGAQAGDLFGGSAAALGRDSTGTHVIGVTSSRDSVSSVALIRRNEPSVVTSARTIFGARVGDDLEKSTNLGAGGGITSVRDAEGELFGIVLGSRGFELAESVSESLGAVYVILQSELIVEMDLGDYGTEDFHPEMAQDIEAPNALVRMLVGVPNGYVGRSTVAVPDLDGDGIEDIVFSEDHFLDTSLPPELIKVNHSGAVHLWPSTARHDPGGFVTMDHEQIVTLIHPQGPDHLGEQIGSNLASYTAADGSLRIAACADATPFQYTQNPGAIYFADIGLGTSGQPISRMLGDPSLYAPSLEEITDWDGSGHGDMLIGGNDSTIEEAVPTNYYVVPTDVAESCDGCLMSDLATTKILGFVSDCVDITVGRFTGDEEVPDLALSGCQHDELAEGAVYVFVDPVPGGTYEAALDAQVKLITPDDSDRGGRGLVRVPLETGEGDELFVTATRYQGPAGPAAGAAWLLGSGVLGGL